MRAILHRKDRKSVKDSRPFLYRLHGKCLAQNCCAPQKERFSRQTRRKAQKYWACISSIFNAVCREKIPFEAVGSLPCTPQPCRSFFVRGIRILTAASRPQNDRVYTPSCHSERAERVEESQKRSFAALRMTRRLRIPTASVRTGLGMTGRGTTCHPERAKRVEGSDSPDN